MSVKTIIASSIARLDSDVLTGGGTDDTAVLQAALDEAKTCGGVRLIMDGAALIHGLKLWSDTVIECLTPDCGFYLADDSNCAVVTNYSWRAYSLDTRNISLIGGTYNDNCRHQAHDIPRPADRNPDAAFGDRQWMMGIEFYGIENLLVRDVVIRNHRTFAFMLGCFKNVTIENVWLDLREKMFAQNQDGFHFWGPGQFLTVRHVGGRVGDDFMNLGPDEHDCKSSISDVLVDGVFLDDADQAIRMLSRGTGRLDRVTVRNVSGCYHGIGFYINPWFPDKTYGAFGNIKIENVDLKPLVPTYNPDSPFLFHIGGNIEALTLKNIYHHLPQLRYSLFDVGYPFYEEREIPADNAPRIGKLTVDGLYVDENDDKVGENSYMTVRCRVDHLILRDVDILRDNMKAAGRMLRVIKGGDIGKLICERVNAEHLSEFIKADGGSIGTVHEDDVSLDDVPGGFGAAGQTL